LSIEDHVITGSYIGCQ